jgi:hypothetical protein
LEIQLSRGEVWIQSTSLSPPHICTCPKPGHRFLSSPSTKQAITSCLHPQQNKQSPLAFTLNKTSNHLLPSPSTKQAITSCLHPQKKGDNDIIMTLEIYVLVWDRYKYVVAINWLIESKPPLLPSIDDDSIARSRALEDGKAKIYRGINIKQSAFSVRCIKQPVAEDCVVGLYKATFIFFSTGCFIQRTLNADCLMLIPL